MGSRALQLALSVIGIFLLISLVIYFSGRVKHQGGEGLSSEISKEFIVQYFARTDPGLRLEAKLAAPALRVKSGDEKKIALKLRNLEASSIEVRIRGELFPANMGKVEIAPEIFLQVAAGETETAEIPLILRSPDIETKDGTLDYVIRVSRAVSK